LEAWEGRRLQLDGQEFLRFRGLWSREDVPSLSTGDSVRHGTLGEGVVTQIEAGGVVTVRFADGSERRLMLDYAPLERIP